MRPSSSAGLALALGLLVGLAGCGDDAGDSDDDATGGSNATGGSSGSSTGGSSTGGSSTGGSSTGGSSTGGSSGSSTGGSSTGGTGGGELCTDRTGGALVDFAVGAEMLRVWIEDDAFIEEAERLLQAHEMRVPVFNTLLDGRDCDEQWTWHPDPADVEFADFTIELCDGTPSYIEENKDEWLSDVGQFCPWSAEVRAVSRQ